MIQSNNAKFTFRSVEVFIATVEEGSVTAAAKRLGASPSAVSLQLSNLESVLDAKLIERTSQRFALTTAGELFHPRALKIMDEITSASAALSQTSVSPRILIKIAMIEDFDRLVLPLWLTAINAKSKNVRFHVKSGPSHENHTALENRTADIIVAVDAMDAAEWVDEYPIMTDPYVVVKSRKLASKTSMPELMGHPFVRYSREQLMGRQIEAHLRRNKAVPPREHEFSSNQAVFSMAEELEGWAITTVSAFLSVSSASSGTLMSSGLTLSKLPVPAFNRTISLYSRRRALGTLPETFADSLKETLDKNFITPTKKASHSIGEMDGLKIL